VTDWEAVGGVPRPSFIEDLESGRSETAREEFSRYALAMLSSRPPRVLRSVSAEDRQDFVREVLLHFLTNDMRVLRRYHPMGGPFAAWFVVVAGSPSLPTRSPRWPIVTSYRSTGS